MVSVRRSRRLAGLFPEVVDVLPEQMNSYYPSGAPRQNTTCSYVAVVLSGLLGMLTVARVLAEF